MSAHSEKKLFYSISEAAQQVDVPQHVLRFWETKFSIIKPVKKTGGRRYYRPEDIQHLRIIRDLLYDQGYTIKGVQGLIKKGYFQKNNKPSKSDLVFLHDDAGRDDDDDHGHGHADMNETYIDRAQRHADGNISNARKLNPLLRDELENILEELQLMAKTLKKTHH